MEQTPVAAGKSSFSLVDTGILKEALAPLEGLVILDAACGRGNYTLPLARWAGLNSRIYAVDLWEDGIFELRKRILEAGLNNIEAMVADLSQGTTLAPESVDFCLAATMLHDLKAVNKHEGVLTALFRTLKKNARLAIIEFEKKESPSGPPLDKRLSYEDLLELVTPFGFKADKSLKIGDYLYLALFHKL